MSETSMGNPQSKAHKANKAHKGSKGNKGHKLGKGCKAHYTNPKAKKFCKTSSAKANCLEQHPAKLFTCKTNPAKVGPGGKKANKSGPERTLLIVGGVVLALAILYFLWRVFGKVTETVRQQPGLAEAVLA